MAEVRRNVDVDGNAEGEQQNGPQAVIQNQIVAKKRTMGDYRIKFNDDLNRNIPEYANLPGWEKASIILGDRGSGNSHQYLAFQLNLTEASGEVARDNTARATYYLGCILSIFYGIAEAGVEDMRNSGFTVEVIRAPSKLGENGLAMPDQLMKPRKILAIWGYLILTLFKAISPDGFPGWTERRLRALYAVAGYEREDDDPLMIFQDLTHAKTFRTLIGQNDALRMRILKMVLALKRQANIMGAVCSYIAGILAWNDMSTINFIYETLVIPDSPVLYHPEVAAEVIRLIRASDEILKSEEPQYFRIFADHTTGAVMEKANFPKLLTIAKRLKGITEKNVENFVGAGLDAKSGVISNLIALHNNYIATKYKAGNLTQRIKRFTNLGYDESDD